MAPSRSSRRYNHLQHPYYHQQHQDPFNMFTSWIPTNEFEDSDEEERLLREALARKQQQRLARQRQLQLQREQERQREYERARAIAEYEAEQHRIRERQIRQEQLRRQREEAQRQAAIQEIFRRQLAYQEEQERLRRQRAAAAEQAARAKAIAEAKRRRQEEEEEEEEEEQYAETQSEASSDAESEEGEDLLEDMFASLFFPHLKRRATSRPRDQQPNKRVHRRARAEQKRIEQAKHEAAAKAEAEAKAKAEAEAKAKAEAEAKAKAEAEAKARAAVEAKAKAQAQAKKRRQVREQQKRQAIASDTEDEDLVHKYFAAFPEIKQFVETALGGKTQPIAACSPRKSHTAPKTATTSVSKKEAPAETPKIEAKPATPQSPSPNSSPELRAADILRERQERQRQEEQAKESKHSELNKIELALDDLSNLLDRVVQGLVENKRQIYQVEEDVTKTMIRIDSVESNGDQSIRKRRKELIKKSQNLLDAIDNHKNLLAKMATNKKKYATTVEDAPVTPAYEKEIEFIHDETPSDAASSSDDEPSSTEVETPSNSDVDDKCKKNVKDLYGIFEDSAKDLFQSDNLAFVH
ncbi:hypothetical protein BGW42_003427 [Actinomortierella wolfii]|nr:hypothetical protein BGW42_003427 [Actinomortierella wolfii]